jgi:predicted amidohydrolase
MAFDLILKGGRIIDPSQKLDRIADIGFAAGKVAKIGADLAGCRHRRARRIRAHRRRGPGTRAESAGLSVGQLVRIA